MKKNLMMRLIVFAASTLISSGAFSQAIAQNSTTTSVISADKMALASLKNANIKMYNHFNRNFKNATDIHIRPNPEFTQVTFKEDGISHSVHYSKKGQWKYSVRTYDESKLSDAIRNDVEAAYPGFLVFGFVNEVDALNKTAILVMIENKDSWKRIRLVDDQMDEYESYQKAK